MKRRRVEIYFYKGKNGLFYWRAKSPNGKIVGASTEGYHRRRDCQRNQEVYGFGALRRVVDGIVYWPDIRFSKDWFPKRRKK